MLFIEAMQILMDEQGINARKLSEKSGVTPQYLSKLNKRKVISPTWDKACAIISALGTDPDSFKKLMDSDK